MTMTEIGLLAFGVFLLLLIVLDVGMIVSLVRQGDERRQDDRLEDQYLYIIGGLWCPGAGYH